MNFKTLAIPALAAVMATAPLAPASAHDGFWHGRGFSHGGPGPVLGILGGVLVGAAAVASLPFQAVGAVAEPVAVAPPPPPQPYYAPQAAYYPPQPVYAAPVYYAPAPVVYGRGYYYR